MKRPHNVSRYLWNKFISAFESGCKFWTSEDGMPTDIVILRTADACDILKREFDVDVKLSDLKEAWVYQEWIGHEWYDSSGRTGKIWRILDVPTYYPVYVHELN